MFGIEINKKNKKQIADARVIGVEFLQNLGKYKNIRALVIDASNKPGYFPQVIAPALDPSIAPKAWSEIRAEARQRDPDATFNEQERLFILETHQRFLAIGLLFDEGYIRSYPATPEPLT
jgi:hypothetical protein